MYHIKENMKKGENGNATKTETEYVDKYVFSENSTTAATNKTELLTSVNSRTKEYIKESLFLNNSDPSCFCDTHVINSKQTQDDFPTEERKNVQSSQLSESFHSVMKKEISYPIPVLINEVLKKRS